MPKLESLYKKLHSQWRALSDAIWVSLRDSPSGSLWLSMGLSLGLSLEDSLGPSLGLLLMDELMRHAEA